MGEELRATDGLARDLGPWRVSRQSDSAVRVVLSQPGPGADIPAAWLDIVEPVGEVWRQEISLNDLTVREGRPYTLSFWVRSEAPRTVQVDVSNQGPDDWREVGYGETLEVGPRWRQVERVFLASETVEGNARLCFKFGGSGADVYLADVRLRRGGHLRGVAAGESLERVLNEFSFVISTIAIAGSSTRRIPR